MEHNFADIVKLSLDNDLKDMVESKRAAIDHVILLQMLRIMRGRPFKIELNAPNTSAQGWSPDGVRFYPSEPGTFTTGGGPVPPTEA
jgi:hypothetical protein